MFYKTRVMIALADFPHGAELLRQGDTFIATEIDADYYLSRKKAKIADDPAAAQVHASIPALAPVLTPAPETAQEPLPEQRNEVADDAAPVNQIPATVAAEEQAPAADQPAAAEAPAESVPAEATEAAAPAPAPAPAPATGRRRGRAAQNSTASE